jgi:hypothetical protein
MLPWVYSRLYVDSYDLQDPVEPSYHCDPRFKTNHRPFQLRSDSITSDPLASEPRLDFSLKGPLRLRFRPGPSFLLHPQLCTLSSVERRRVSLTLRQSLRSKEDQTSSAA